MSTYTMDSLRCTILALLADEGRGCQRGQLNALFWCAADAMNSVDSLRADNAKAVETLTAVNQWVAEAKPLLERGGKAEGELKQLREVNSSSLKALKNAEEWLEIALGNEPEDYINPRLETDLVEIKAAIALAESQG